MKKYFCDYCGKEVVDNGDFLELFAIDINNDVTDEFGHLCEECLAKVANFLKQMKEDLLKVFIEKEVLGVE